MWAHCKYTATSTHGERLLVMELRLPGDPDPLARTWAMSPQSPGTISRYQLFPGGPAVFSTIPEGVVYLPLPVNPVMLEKWQFTLKDSANVDPNDHLELRAMVVLEEKQ